MRAILRLPFKSDRDNLTECTINDETFVVPLEPVFEREILIRFRASI